MKAEVNALTGIDPSRNLEIHPDANGWLILDGGAVVGELQIDSGEMRFKWTSSTAEWPSTFTVEKPSGQTVPSLSVDHTYEHQQFPGSSASHDVSGCDYKIVSGGNVIGWLKRNGSDTEWYGVPAYVSGGYLVVSNDAMTFKPNDATGNETAHKVVDDEV